ncbi:MAG: formate dehydrogenase accessory protein FdhE [Ectothiorhodospiraceae bacterium]|jgi:FdhE protein|nr:formate dehydrogenase accessory protein FdhE [Ectothiorhodospiraceae bacterium]
MTAVIQPGQITEAQPEVPALRPADRKIFRRRAERLRALAAGHAMEDYLSFMARLADAQQSALDIYSEVPEAIPDPQAVARARDLGLPPFPAQGWARDSSWRAALRNILEDVRREAPEPLRIAIDELMSMASAELEEMADRILTGNDPMLDPATAPLIGAALQVYWTHLSTSIDQADPQREQQPSTCPVCGSHPVASLRRIGGVEQGLRYLHCSLCETEWNYVRIKCTSCESTTGIGYYGVDGEREAVEAEACDDCHGYLKLMHMERDADVDAIADDLATLALDIAMADEGYTRVGLNLLFVPGEEVSTAN